MQLYVKGLINFIILPVNDQSDFVWSLPEGVERMGVADIPQIFSHDLQNLISWPQPSVFVSGSFLVDFMDEDRSKQRV